MCLALAVACAPTGKYTWVDEYVPPARIEKPYVIGPGDVILVRVFNQEQLSTRARVRADGKVSLPLLNDVPAAGFPPVALASNLEVKLKDFVKNPLVTVSLEETRQHTVLVAGEVTKPGAYPLEEDEGVLQAIVNGGGLTPDASSDRIFVLRNHEQPVRIRFRYDSLLKMDGKAPGFRLQPGDIVLVE